jgi:hypothetical protein
MEGDLGLAGGFPFGALYFVVASRAEGPPKADAGRQLHARKRSSSARLLDVSD